MNLKTLLENLVSAVRDSEPQRAQSSFRSCLVKTDPGVALRYAAFGAVPVRA